MPMQWDHQSEERPGLLDVVGKVYGVTFREAVLPMTGILLIWALPVPGLCSPVLFKTPQWLAYLGEDI